MADGRRVGYPDYLVIGRVTGAWGTKGELKVQVLTDFAQRFSPGADVFIQGQRFAIEGSHQQGKSWVIKLSSIDDVEAAAALRGRELEVPRESGFRLPPGQYYWFQIVGLQVYTTQGEHVGEVVQVLPNPANDCYLVRGQRGEVLVPAVEDVVISIDLDNGKLVIEPIPGLL